MAMKTKKRKGMANVAAGKARLAAARPKLKKFKVKEGIHYHGQAVWTKNMVVASRLDLDKMFLNKFERMPDEVSADKGIENFKYETPGMAQQHGVKTGRQKVSLDPEDFGDENEATGPEVKAVDDEELSAAHYTFLQGAQDVTDDFPFVKEEARGLVVLRNGKDYGIVSSDNPREILNTDKPLRKSEVDGFVEAFLDGDLPDGDDDDDDDDDE